MYAVGLYMHFNLPTLQFFYFILVQTMNYLLTFLVAPCKIPRIQNGQIGPILSRDNQLLSRDQQQLSTSASSIASVFRRQIKWDMDLFLWTLKR